jgi:hypothetical protein
MRNKQREKINSYRILVEKILKKTMLELAG